MVYDWRRRALWWHGDPLCHRRAQPPDVPAFDRALGRGWRHWARRRPPLEPCDDGATRCTAERRPCRFFRCPFSLAAEVTWWGSLRLLHPGVPLQELEHTCALDAIRARGRLSTPQVARLVGMSRDGARKLLRRGLQRLRRRLPRGVSVREALAAAGCDTLRTTESRTRCEVLWFG